MDVFASETAPFAVALAVTLSIAVLELVGLLAGLQPSAAIDSALPDLDVDVDAPDLASPDAGFSPLSHVLSWLSFGRLPALVVLLIAASSFGLIGFAEQEFLRRTFGFALDPWIASVPAVVGAAFVTRHLGRGLARIMPREETDAVSTRSFVGRIATIFRGEARPGQPAEAKLVDTRGKTQYLLVEPEDPEQVFPAGSQVLIVSQDGGVYRAITRLKPAP
ncbi:YqiJ family protein [Devosia nitrariae]|uniref:DUF1449 family protein n=1 Tax=Devosia nitrariae TaxID=2071872 RepID=A0ABQ5W720_9HYPH|nr:YqiJ family protein [Devosia nitrariae]GLQ55571.1 hypothetical protein GCM10010862_28300 [Devosia nitrariae]